MKIVISRGIYGFDLTEEMVEILVSKGVDYFESWETPNYTKTYIQKAWYGEVKYETPLRNDRTNQLLIEAIKESKNETYLRVVEIPDNTKYYIDTNKECKKYVRERSRSWGEYLD